MGVVGGCGGEGWCGGWEYGRASCCYFCSGGCLCREMLVFFFMEETEYEFSACFVWCDMCIGDGVGCVCVGCVCECGVCVCVWVVCVCGVCVCVRCG